MADIPSDDLDNLFDDFEAASAVGTKVLEMCDRLKVASQIVPGAQARWTFEMDGHAYDVVVTMRSDG